MTALARTCVAEWTRLWTVRASWWCLGAAALVLAGLGTLLGFEAASDPPQLQGESAWRTPQYLALPAQFALLAFALLAVTADYATGGIIPALQWTPRRGLLFTARALLTVLVATTCGVLLALVGALGAFATARSAMVLPLDGGVEMLATVAFVFAAGSALAVGLGFLLRSTAGALVTVFLLLLLLPLLLPQLGYSWLTAVADRLPGTGALFLLLDAPQDREISRTTAILSLLAWASAALALGWLRLRRADARAT